MRAFLLAKKPFTQLAAPIGGKVLRSFFQKATASPRVAAGGTHPRPLHLPDKLQFIIYYYDKTDKKTITERKKHGQR